MNCYTGPHTWADYLEPPKKWRMDIRYEGEVIVWLNSVNLYCTEFKYPTYMLLVIPFNQIALRFNISY